MSPGRLRLAAIFALVAIVAVLAERRLAQGLRSAPEAATAAVAGSAPQFGPQPPPPARPLIEGDARFVAQVSRALELLAERAPDAHAAVLAYIGRIRQGAHSGMRAFEDPPTLELGDPSTFYSVTWCAGSIVHDAHHSRLYHEWLAAHGAPVPAAEWTGTAIELACNRIQLAVLECIGAPPHEVTHLAAQDGTHWDVNRDGVNDERDLELRNW